MRQAVAGKLNVDNLQTHYPICVEKSTLVCLSYEERAEVEKNQIVQELCSLFNRIISTKIFCAMENCKYVRHIQRELELKNCKLLSQVPAALKFFELFLCTQIYVPKEPKNVMFSSRFSSISANIDSSARNCERTEFCR